MQKLKILVIGPEKTGKSSICNIIYNPDQTNQIYWPTIGVRILDIEKEVKIDNRTQNVKIQLFDISGNQKYEQYYDSITDNTDGIIIVCNADIPS